MHTLIEGALLLAAHRLRTKICVLVLHLILDAANLVIELIRYVILLSFNVI